MDVMDMLEGGDMIQLELRAKMRRSLDLETGSEVGWTVIPRPMFQR